MTRTAIHNLRSLGEIRRLVRKHFFQVRAKPQPPELANVLAITFRPSAHTGSFNGNLLRRVGTTTMIVLSYDPNRSKPGRLAMPIRGFQAQAHPDGSVHLGGDAGCLFLHDGSLIPRACRTRGAINAARNPTLVQTLLRLDRACKSQIGRLDRLPQVPQLPRILLGFAPNEPPEFEDSPALRRLAAEELGIPVERLGANGSVLLDRLLRDLWQRHLILPSGPGNSTGKLLVDAELCSQARRALEIYEDFTDLVGAHTWNPAQEIKLRELDNPAKDVLCRHDIDTSQNFNQYFSDELIERLELAMREAIGPVQTHFTLEEILDALTNPDQPLVGHAHSLAKLRSSLSTDVAECCTDDDLVRATWDPSQPLLASGASRVQVLSTRQVPDVFRFQPEDLRRRAKLDLTSSGWFNRRLPFPALLDRRTG